MNSKDPLLKSRATSNSDDIEIVKTTIRFTPYEKTYIFFCCLSILLLFSILMSLMSLLEDDFPIEIIILETVTFVPSLLISIFLYRIRSAITIDSDIRIPRNIIKNRKNYKHRFHSIKHKDIISVSLNKNLTSDQIIVNFKDDNGLEDEFTIDEIKHNIDEDCLSEYFELFKSLNPACLSQDQRIPNSGAQEDSNQVSENEQDAKGSSSEINDPTDSYGWNQESNTYQKSRDEQGWTTLMHACNNGNVDEVLSLIKRGADINAVDNFGYTALIRLASLGGSISSRFSERHFEAMKILVDSNAKLNEQDNEGFTALNWAAEKGHANAVKLLLNAGANPEIRGNDGATPYDVATTPEVRALFRSLNEKTPPEEQLLIAAENGDKDSVKELLSQGVDPNFALSTGNTALFAAVGGKHYDLMQLLLDNGADPDIATDGDQRTPLILAAQMCDPTSVELLLNEQADVNKTDANGASALTKAVTASFCSNEDKESVLTLLLDAGIDTSIKTFFGYTAIEVAEKNNCQSAADFIRDYKE